MLQMQEKCTVCHHSNIKPLYPVSEGKLVRCQHCELIFFTPRPSEEELATFYNTISYREEYQKSPMAGYDFAQGRYRELLTLINRYAPYLLSKDDKHFLDIGCGVGDLLNIAARDGWHITGTELSPLAAKQANVLLDNKVLTGDIISLNLPDNSYDLITIYHVIEHLLDPIHTLTKIQQLLKPGGIAFIETPNIASLGARIRGRKWSHIIPPEHITYFQSTSLRYALKQSGFQEFKVFTSAPQVVGSVLKWPQPFRSIVTNVYRLAPLFGMGAAVQAIAFK